MQQLTALASFLAKEKKLTVTYDQSVYAFLAQKGRDSVFGARPLKRAIQHFILDKLALDIIEGKINEGDSIACVVEKGEIRFS